MRETPGEAEGDTGPERRRYRLNLRLRTLILPTAMIGVGYWMEMHARRHRVQRRAIQQVRTIGCWAQTVPGWPGWLRHLTGRDYFEKRTHIEYRHHRWSPALGGLPQRGLGEVRGLSLVHVGVDDDLERLRTLSLLEVLYIPPIKLPMPA